MKTRGFTLIELMISIAIVGILVSVVFSAIKAGGSDSDISFGVNGIVETRCVGGYQFIVGAKGGARQVMDEFGHGVKCQEGVK